MKNVVTNYYVKYILMGMLVKPILSLAHTTKKYDNSRVTFKGGFEYVNDGRRTIFLSVVCTSTLGEPN